MTQTLNSVIIRAYYLVVLSRPQNVVYSGLLSAGSAYYVGASAFQALLCYVLLFCLYSIAASLNNLADVETDRLNKRIDNPLASQRIKLVDLYLYLATLFVSTLIVQIWLTQPISLLLTAFFIICLLAYSVKPFSVQARGLLAPLLLSACYGTLPLIIGLTQTRVFSKELIILGLLQIFLLSPLLMAKDYKDEKGDRITGKITPFIKYGYRRILQISTALATVGSLIVIALTAIMGQNLIISIPIILYISSVLILHHNRGKVSRYFLRIPQFSALLISWWTLNIL